jgi:hypothetical protein
VLYLIGNCINLCQFGEGLFLVSKNRNAFLARIISTIIQWKTYIAFIVDDKLLLNNEMVDEFVAMVGRAIKIYGEGDV